MRMVLGLAAALLSPSATLAQVSPAAPAAAPVDPERLKAAQALIDQILPPSTRQEMMQAMMAPVLANIRQAMTQNPRFAKAIGEDPKIKILFDEFMERQINRSAESLRASLPGMTEAMARAYARRFDTQQLREIAAFFATQTGQIYMKASMSIMSDPDVAAWQRSVMSQSMIHVQDDVADFAKKIAALQSEKKP